MTSLLKNKNRRRDNPKVSNCDALHALNQKRDVTRIQASVSFFISSLFAFYVTGKNSFYNFSHEQEKSGSPRSDYEKVVFRWHALNIGDDADSETELNDRMVLYASQQAKSRTITSLYEDTRGVNVPFPYEAAARGGERACLHSAGFFRCLLPQSLPEKRCGMKEQRKFDFCSERKIRGEHFLRC